MGKYCRVHSMEVDTEFGDMVVELWGYGREWGFVFTFLNLFLLYVVFEIMISVTIG
jgi:hypothetical protein